MVLQAVHIKSQLSVILERKDNGGMNLLQEFETALLVEIDKVDGIGRFLHGLDIFDLILSVDIFVL